MGQKFYSHGVNFSHGAKILLSWGKFIFMGQKFQTMYKLWGQTTAPEEQTAVIILDLHRNI